MSKKSFDQRKEKNITKWSYEDFYTEAKIETGLRDGNFFKGILRVNAQKRYIAYVSVTGASVDILIENEQYRNRALNGNEVYVELLPERLWTTPMRKPPVDIIGTSSSKSEVDEATDMNGKLWRPRQNILQTIEEIQSDSPKAMAMHPIDELVQLSQFQPSGKVIGIITRQPLAEIVGSLEEQKSITPGTPLPPSVAYVKFKPSDLRYPDLIINRLEMPEAYSKDPVRMQKQVFIADIDPIWPKDSKLPRGKNLRSLGEMGNIHVETTALLLEHGVNHDQFQDNVVEPLRQLLGIEDADSSSKLVNWEIPEDEIKNRLDLRSRRIFTIDPPTAKDLDDALHIELLDDGTFEIGVHIADVSYFVPEHSALDIEALNRATSVYLVQKVIPMLPPILCEQLCSLNPNVDRLAFSCIWRMNKDGSLCEGDPWFGRTVIRSCAKLDYPTAQRMIDGIIPNAPCTGGHEAYFSQLSEDVWESSRRPPMEHHPWSIALDVCHMNNVAVHRRSARLSYGALTLNHPKLTFSLDENGNPTAVSTYVIKQSNQLVEEFMLLANYLVAQELVIRCGKAAFLRRHPPPKLQYLKDLQDLTANMGFPIDTSSARSLQEGLSRMTLNFDPVLVQAVTACMTKPMQLAEYFTVNAFNNKSDAWRHYALAIPYYTHFTSPIRRYADLVVHRLLGKVFAREPVDQSAQVVDRLQMIADQCNQMKKSSKYAQERSDEVFLAVYLVNNSMNADGVVIGIGPKSFTVLVPSLGIQSRLFTDEMPDLITTYDESRKVITLTRLPAKEKVDKSKVSGESNRPGGSMRMTRMDITLMSRVVVHLTAKSSPPIGIRFTLIESEPLNSNSAKKATNSTTGNVKTATSEKPSVQGKALSSATAAADAIRDASKKKQVDHSKTSQTVSAAAPAVVTQKDGTNSGSTGKVANIENATTSSNESKRVSIWERDELARKKRDEKRALEEMEQKKKKYSFVNKTNDSDSCSSKSAKELTIWERDELARKKKADAKAREDYELKKKRQEEEREKFSKRSSYSISDDVSELSEKSNLSSKSFSDMKIWERDEVRRKKKEERRRKQAEEERLQTLATNQNNEDTGSVNSSKSAHSVRSMRSTGSTSSLWDRDEAHRKKRRAEAERQAVLRAEEERRRLEVEGLPWVGDGPVVAVMNTIPFPPRGGQPLVFDTAEERYSSVRARSRSRSPGLRRYEGEDSELIVNDDEATVANNNQSRSESPERNRKPRPNSGRRQSKSPATPTSRGRAFQSPKKSIDSPQSDNRMPAIVGRVKSLEEVLGMSSQRPVSSAVENKSASDGHSSSIKDVAKTEVAPLADLPVKMPDTLSAGVSAVKQSAVPLPSPSTAQPPKVSAVKESAVPLASSSTAQPPKVSAELPGKESAVPLPSPSTVQPPKVSAELPGKESAVPLASPSTAQPPKVSAELPISAPTESQSILDYKASIRERILSRTSLSARASVLQSKVEEPVVKEPETLSPITKEVEDTEGNTGAAVFTSLMSKCVISDTVGTTIGDERSVHGNSEKIVEYATAVQENDDHIHSEEDDQDEYEDLNQGELGDSGSMQDYAVDGPNISLGSNYEGSSDYDPYPAYESVDESSKLSTDTCKTHSAPNSRSFDDMESVGDESSVAVDSMWKSSLYREMLRRGTDSEQDEKLQDGSSSLLPPPFLPAVALRPPLPETLASGGMKSSSLVSSNGTINQLNTNSE